MNIAWTCLLHAYYRHNEIEYRYFTLTRKQKKRFSRTNKRAYKFWELKRCSIMELTPLSGIDFHPVLH
ncbi:MAG: DUF3644 domain-containing protein [Puniceicoccales bacterium]|nr:DUF3644 domain-containing protein [Puniceicoccales bacterium]